MRSLLITVAVTLTLVSPPLAKGENKRAANARDAYHQAMKNARTAFIKELETAIEETEQAGARQETSQLKSERDALLLEAQEDRDPVQRAANRLENTVWRTRSNPKGFLRFMRGNRTFNHLRKGGAWIMTDETTAITQSRNSGHIYLFEFSKDLKSATVHRFENAKEPKKFTRQY